MGHYPAIKDFIQQKAGGVKNLGVTYTQGAPPNLYMKDAAGAVVEEVLLAMPVTSRHLRSQLSHCAVGGRKGIRSSSPILLSPPTLRPVPPSSA